jgi:hypothetical protein
MEIKTTTVQFSSVDLRIIARLKRKYESEHGKLTVSGVIRIALRKALQP